MPFATPQYPLKCNIWRNGLNPINNPPTLANQPCNLTQGPLPFVLNLPYSSAPLIFIMRCPSNVDIRPAYLGLFAGGQANDDYVECPAGSGQFFDVQSSCIVGFGFPNEHRRVVLLRVQPAYPAS